MQLQNHGNFAPSSDWLIAPSYDASRSIPGQQTGTNQHATSPAQRVCVSPPRLKTQPFPPAAPIAGQLVGNGCFQVQGYDAHPMDSLSAAQERVLMNLRYDLEELETAPVIEPPQCGKRPALSASARWVP